MINLFVNDRHSRNILARNLGNVYLQNLEKFKSDEFELSYDSNIDIEPPDVVYLASINTINDIVINKLEFFKMMHPYVPIISRIAHVDADSYKLINLYKKIHSLSHGLIYSSEYVKDIYKFSNRKDIVIKNGLIANSELSYDNNESQKTNAEALLKSKGVVADQFQFAETKEEYPDDKFKVSLHLFSSNPNKGYSFYKELDAKNSEILFYVPNIQIASELKNKVIIKPKFGKDLFNHLRNLDAFIVGPENDPTPNSMLEMLSLNKPVFVHKDNKIVNEYIDLTSSNDFVFGSFEELESKIDVYKKTKPKQNVLAETWESEITKTYNFIKSFL